MENINNSANNVVPSKRKSLVKKVKKSHGSRHSSMSLNANNSRNSSLMLRDSISVLIANHDDKRKGSSGFIIPRYTQQNNNNGQSAANSVNQDENYNQQMIQNVVDSNDIFELGEVPMHLIREYKTTYSQQISIEKFLILKVKETEKENRLLRSQLDHVKNDKRQTKKNNNISNLSNRRKKEKSIAQREVSNNSHLLPKSGTDGVDVGVNANFDGLSASDDLGNTQMNITMNGKSIARASETGKQS